VLISIPILIGDKPYCNNYKIHCQLYSGQKYWLHRVTNQQLSST